MINWKNPINQPVSQQALLTVSTNRHLDLHSLFSSPFALLPSLACLPLSLLPLPASLPLFTQPPSSSPPPPSHTLPWGTRLPLFSPLKDEVERRLLLGWLDLANSPLVKQVVFGLRGMPVPLYFHISFKFHPPYTPHTQHTHTHTYTYTPHTHTHIHSTHTSH